jgi:hypothetical protein
MLRFANLLHMPPTLSTVENLRLGSVNNLQPHCLVPQTMIWTTNRDRLGSCHSCVMSLDPVSRPMNLSPFSCHFRVKFRPRPESANFLSPQHALTEHASQNRQAIVVGESLVQDPHALTEHASQNRQAIVVGESLVQDPHARVRV